MPNEIEQNEDIIENMSTQDLSKLLDGADENSEMTDVLTLEGDDTLNTNKDGSDDEYGASEDNPKVTTGENIGEGTDTPIQEEGTEVNPEEEISQEDLDKEAPQTKAEEAEKKTKKKVKEQEDETFQALISTPYKVKGRNVDIDSVEDARNLISKGLAFEENQKKLKEYIPIMTALSENNVSNPKDIARLIDISKGNVDAIKDIIKEHNIDVFDENFIEENKEYTPETKLKSSESIALNSKVNEYDGQSIQGQLINVLNKDFEDSLIEFSKDPTLIDGLADHIESGAYYRIIDKVNSMERSNSFPKNLTFIDKYDTVFTEMKKEEQNSSNEQDKPKAGNSKSSSRIAPNKGEGKSNFDPDARNNLSSKIGKPQQKANINTERNITNLKNIGTNDLQDLLNNMN